MKKTVGLFSVLLLSIIVCGQKQIPYYNSQEVITQSSNYFENEDYSKAIKELSKIHSSDTSYNIAQVEKLRAYFLDKQYEQAIQLGNKVLKNDPHHQHRFVAYLLSSSSFIEQKKYKEAIQVLDNGIKELPYNVTLHYQKGIVYEKSKQYQKALEVYKHNLEVFPFHSLTHLRLAYLALNENHIVEAVLSVNMYLALTPYHSDAQTVLFEFDGFLKDKTSFEPRGIVLSEEGDNYARLKLLVENGIANDKKYKYPSKLKFSFTRQTHFILSQLKYNKNDKGFWHQYYLPFYSKMMAEERFEAFSYYTVLSLEKTNTLVAKMASKKQSDIRDLHQWKEKEIYALHKSFIGDFDGQKNVKLSAVYETDGRLKMLGLAQDDLTSKQGKWLSFSYYGQLEGFYHFKDNVTIGKWQLRNVEKNVLQLESVLENNKLNGPFTVYYDNGKVKEVGTFKNGQRHGLSTHYSVYGSVYKKENYQEGVLHGERSFYYPTGDLSFQENYKNGKLDGTHKGYFINQNVRSVFNYENGVQTGVEEFYYSNGQLKQKQTLVKDLIQGDRIEYYPTGQIYKEGQVKKQHYVGIVKVYYPTGKLYKEQSYNDAGKLHGVTKEYLEDGQQQSEITYVRGKYVGYKFFTKKGELTREGKVSKGVLNFESYNAYGTLLAKGTMKSNEQEGNWYYYNEYGALISVEKYDKGRLKIDSSFYENRQVKTITHYNDEGLRDGYTQYYSIHGDLKKEGWVKNGNVEGVWVYYYSNGVVKDSNYFVSNQLEGVQKSFDITGKLRRTDNYQNGVHLAFSIYDNTGKKTSSHILADWKNGEKVKLYSPNKTLLNEGIRYDNVLHEQQVWYHANGQIAHTGAYENDEKHGEHIWYHENGKKSVVENYVYGSLEGESKRFYETGELKSLNVYKHGKLQKESLSYYPNGKLTIKSAVNYTEDRHGKTYYYSPEGQVQHIRYYDNGCIIGYSYLGKDGKEVPMIKIENGTTKCVNYFPNGKKSMEFTLKNGLFEGDYSRYYENGQIQRKSFYENGDEMKTRIEYYANGKTSIKAPYIKDKKHGICEYFDKNGQKTFSKEYNTGYLHGKNHYYSNGKIVKTEHYYFDDFIQ